MKRICVMIMAIACLLGSCMPLGEDAQERVFHSAVELWIRHQVDTVEATVGGTTLPVQPGSDHIDWENWLSKPQSYTIRSAKSDAAYQVITVELGMPEASEALMESYGDAELRHYFEIWMDRKSRKIHRIAFNKVLSRKQELLPQEEALRWTLQLELENRGGKQ